MNRPAHLPDFLDPPLDEVVLGVQFSPIQDYSSVFAGNVHSLFQSEYPMVAEQPLLERRFETFGGGNVQAGPRIQVGQPPIGSRLWFLSQDENHLLQFQADMFLSNWRRRPNTQQYPRFEGLSEAFERNLRQLEDFFRDSFEAKIEVNQAEVSYINVIPVDGFADAEARLEVWNGGKIDVESVNLSFSEIIRDKDGKPFARLLHQVTSVYTMDGKERALRLSLSFKGKPQNDTIGEAMDFLGRGREAIVLRFKEVTTSKAHKAWGIIE